MSLAASVPFDDRMNQTATLDDLDLGLMRAYLKQVKSDLFAEAAKMDFVRLCRRMNIVDGPDEAVRPKNVGLMFFNDSPSQFFPQTQIDVVHFPEGLGADSFTETIFTGPLHVMLQDALAHIRSTVIVQSWCQLQNFNKARLGRFGGGSTVSGICRNDLKELKITLPILPEQICIAMVLFTCD